MTSQTKNPYKRNFLSRVVLQLNYETMELGKLEEFYKTIKSDFPLQEQKDGVNREMTIDFSKGKILSNNGEQLKIWTFLSATKKKKLTITPTMVTVEYIERSYKNKDELIGDLQKFVLPYLQFFQITVINRLGLRYINDINLNTVKKDFEWSSFFNRDLIGGSNLAKKLKVDVARSMSTLEISSESENIKFHYGIWNKDYPNENTRNEFILDIDCYSKFPHDVDSGLEKMIIKYNKKVESIFEKSITKKMREFLNK